MTAAFFSYNLTARENENKCKRSAVSYDNEGPPPLPPPPVIPTKGIVSRDELEKNHESYGTVRHYKIYNVTQQQYIFNSSIKRWKKMVFYLIFYALANLDKLICCPPPNKNLTFRISAGINASETPDEKALLGNYGI